MKWLTLIALMTSFHVHARLAVTCSLTKTFYDDLNSDHKWAESRKIEYERVWLEFGAPGDNGVARAQIQFDFPLIPNTETILTIDESVVDGKIQWKNWIQTRNRETGKVIRSGWPHIMVVRSQNAELSLMCEVSDRYRAPFTQPANERERLRLIHAGGPANFREYTYETPKIDWVDLFIQFSEQDLQFSRKIDARLTKLNEEGFVPHVGAVEDDLAIEPTTEDGKTVACPANVNATTCELQNVNLRRRYYLNGGQRSKIFEIQGQIYRDRSSREILLLWPKSYNIEEETSRQYGRASSSGGRLMP